MYVPVCLSVVNFYLSNNFWSTRNKQNNTVNFGWGKISRKCWQDISCGGNFHDTISIFFIKTYGFYFHVGGNFHEEDKSVKITPTRKFPRLQYHNLHLYSTEDSHSNSINEPYRQHSIMVKLFMSLVGNFIRILKVIILLPVYCSRTFN